MRTRLDITEQVLLLLTLVPFLRDNGPTPMTELAERFDVAPDVLRRLFRFLGTAGVPGETQTYQHEDLFDIDWDLLERDDIAALVRPVVIDDVPRFAPAETAALIAGLQLVTPLLPPEQAALARSTAAKLGAAFNLDSHTVPLAATAEPHDARLPVLVQAILEHRDVRFAYRDGQGADTRRTVTPVRLDQAVRAWYLRAWCHDRAEERTFRLDRMSELTLDERRPGGTAEGPVVPSVPEPRVSPLATGTPVTETAADAPTVLLRARVRARSLPRLSSFGPTALEDDAVPGNVTHTEGAGDGDRWVRVSVEVRTIRAAVTLVQQAPGDVVIQSPQAAVTAVREWADLALAQYEHADSSPSLS